MNTEFKGAKGFLMLPIGISRDHVLLKKPKTIILMGEIVTMLNITGRFFMSNARLAEILQVSRSTLIEYLNMLESLGYIQRTIVKDENGQIKGREIKAGATLIEKQSLGWANINDPSPIGWTSPSPADQTSSSLTDQTTLVRQTGPKYINIKEHDNRSNDIYCQAKDLTRKNNPPYKEIIDYLNEKVGTKYLVEAAKNRRLIRARWNEGFDLDDFKTVIDKKVAQWKDDPKMQTYLRPETLFSGKFDRYLNEKVKKRADLFKENSNSILDIPDEELPF